MASEIIELRARIAENAARLANGISEEGGELTPRARKRIMQKLGKLKKDLAAAIEKATSLGVPIPEEGVTNTTKRPLENVSEGVEDNESATKRPAVDETEIPVLSKKDMKSALHSLNHELSECAVKKQLTRAKKAVRQAERKGVILDVAAASNLLNAYVRCNDVEGALAWFETAFAGAVLSASSAANGASCLRLPPNAVVYTTMLKGFCEVGRMSEAATLFFDRMLPGRMWNMRSLSTFLRGCVRTGWVSTALEAFRDCYENPDSETRAHLASLTTSASEKGVQESACYEAIVSLLCRAGRLNEAVDIVRAYVSRDKSGQSSASAYAVLENAGLYTILAKAFAMIGGFSEARQYVDLASQMVAIGESSGLKETLRKRLLLGEEAPLAGASNNLTPAERSQKNLELFHAHRRSELSHELELLQDYLAIIESVRQLQPPAPYNSDQYMALEACRVYLSSLSTMLFFGFDGEADWDSRNASVKNINKPDTLCGKLQSALQDKFGLESITLSAGITTTPRQSSDIADLLNTVRSTVAEKMSGIVSETESKQYVNTKELFGISSHSKVPPLKIEICSGNGDWVVAQAAADRLTVFDVANSKNESDNLKEGDVRANWLSLELRYDRCHNIFYNQFLSLAALGKHISSTKADAAAANIPQTTVPLKLAVPKNNLAVLGGDAAKIVSSHITPSSVEAVFINFPQPPDRVTGGSDVNQGAHLLTEKFLSDVLAVLKNGGTMTILTDNLPYAQSLSQSIANMNRSAEKAAYAIRRKARQAAESQNNESEVNAEDSPLQYTRFVSVELGEESGRMEQERVRIFTNLERKKLKKAAKQHEDADGVSKMIVEKPNVGTGLAELNVPKDYQKDCVIVYRGDPGSDAGHVASATSYFDRMWAHGQKKRRWFIYVKKVEPEV